MDVPIQIVDESDQPLRAGTKQEAWQNGLRHRIVRIMVDDGDGNILLPKRAATKSPYPGHWDSSAAGHVDAGETYEQAALRELEEELSLTGYVLTEVSYYPTQGVTEGKKLNRFNKLYTTTIPHDAMLRLQPEEVAEAKWFAWPEFLGLVSGHHQVRWPCRNSTALAKSAARRILAGAWPVRWLSSNEDYCY